MPGKDDEMPETIKRSSRKAQRTWRETHDNAVREYGEGERAHRTAYAALMHSFEKRGDRWVPKKAKGPSDPRSAQPTVKAIAGEGKIDGGLDYYGHTKRELIDIAREEGAKVSTHMTKDQIAEAIARRQKRAA